MMKFDFRHRRGWAAAALLMSIALYSLLLPRIAGAAEFRAIATILPVHSLLASVMEGAGAPPDLLVRVGSPHDYTLKPSDARRLAAASLIVRVGLELETFLERPLRTLASSATIVSLLGAEGVRHREFGADPARQHHDDEDHDGHDGHDDHDDHDDEDHGDHGDETHHEHHDHAGTDAHIWLDPANARAMVAALARTLVELDPANSGIYRTNADRLDARLEGLDSEIAGVLKPVADRPFVTFHDAYGYFTERYGLAFAGAVAVDPQRPPGAAHLRSLRDRMRDDAVACVFAEPQFRSGLIEAIVEGGEIRIGTLDPLGADIPPGPEHYFALMRRMAGSLAGCLAGS